MVYADNYFLQVSFVLENISGTDEELYYQMIAFVHLYYETDQNSN